MSETVEFFWGGETVSVFIEGGALGIGASTLLADLRSAVSDAEQAAAEADAAAVSAQAAAVEAQAATFTKADIDGENIVDPTTFRANIVLSSTDVPSFGGLLYNPAVAPSLSHQPTGNVQASPTFGGVVAQKTTGKVDNREIGLSVGLVSNKGTANTNPSGGNGDKITAYFGNVGQSGAYNVWALNALTEVSAGAGTIFGAWGAEIDFNNFCQNAGNPATPLGPPGMGAPRYIGVEVTGANNFQNTAGFVLGSLDPDRWNRGFVVDSASTRDAAFCDYSNAITTLDVWGNHTNIIDLTNTTVSGKILKSPRANLGTQGDLSLVGAFTGLMALIQNTTDAASSQGLKVETRWATPAGRAFQVYVNGQEYFRVDGDPTNPVWVRVGGTLRNVIVDGSGFLKVV